MSGDQNNNQQNQQKQKGGNQNGPKEGITIATSVNPSQSGTLGQQVQGAIVTGIGGAIAALACAGVQKGFDWLVNKWTGRKINPVFNTTPTAPTGSGNLMGDMHTLVKTNPQEAERIFKSIAKYPNMQAALGATHAPTPTPVEAGVVEMTPSTPAPVVTPAPTDTVPSPAAMEVKQKPQQPQNKGGKK